VVLLRSPKSGRKIPGYVPKTCSVVEDEAYKALLNFAYYPCNK